MGEPSPPPLISIAEGKYYKRDYIYALSVFENRMEDGNSNLKRTKPIGDPGG